MKLSSDLLSTPAHKLYATDPIESAPMSATKPPHSKFRSVEFNYYDLVQEVRNAPERETRNGITRSLFQRSLSFDLREGLPLLQGRRMHYKSVFGELAAFVRGPTNVKDFQKWGCNYWNDFAKNKRGDLNVDYGNAWFKDGQMDHLMDSLVNNPTDRRMVLTGWIPENLSKLSLPCCHMLYQFYVEETPEDAKNVVHMSWHQRSVDVAIGLPADLILASAMLLAIANAAGLQAGKVHMHFGDCHIYEEHIDGLAKYMENTIWLMTKGLLKPSPYTWLPDEPIAFEDFEPGMIQVDDYLAYDHLPFELKV